MSDKFINKVLCSIKDNNANIEKEILLFEVVGILTIILEEINLNDSDEIKIFYNCLNKKDLFSLKAKNEVIKIIENIL